MHLQEEKQVCILLKYKNKNNIKSYKLEGKNISIRKNKNITLHKNKNYTHAKEQEQNTKEQEQKQNYTQKHYKN